MCLCGFVVSFPTFLHAPLAPSPQAWHQSLLSVLLSFLSVLTWLAGEAVLLPSKHTVKTIANTLF